MFLAWCDPRGPENERSERGRGGDEEGEYEQGGVAASGVRGMCDVGEEEGSFYLYVLLPLIVDFPSIIAWRLH